MRKKKMKGLIAAVLSLVLALSMTACGGSGGGEEAESGDQIVIRLAHVEADSSILHQSAEKFEEYVEEQTDGQVDVQLYANSELGDEVALLDSVKMGNLDLSILNVTNYTMYDDKFSVMSFPYLFSSVEECEEMTRGALGELFSTWMDEEGFECLGYQYDGSRNISNNVRPIYTPDDCEGLKIRSMDSDIYIRMFECMGCNPTPMGFSEIYTSAQQGVIDGNDNPSGTFYEAKFQEVHKYYSMTQHTYGQSTIVGNKEKLAQLPENVYTAIKEGAGQFLVDWQREAAQAAEEDYLTKINDEGCTVNEVDEENIQKFRELMTPLYNEYKEKIDADAWAQIEEAIGRSLT